MLDAYHEGIDDINQLSQITIKFEEGRYDSCGACDYWSKQAGKN
jgi:hypothetical protein